ncbi:hypothetical protein ACFLVD_01080, partial [Chloroflexota bacterium]
KKGLKLLGLAVGVVTIMALSLGGTVFAATPEDTDTQAYCAGYGWHGFQGAGAICSEIVSELLGLTPEQLCDLRQEGKSLADIAAEKNVNVYELVEAIMAEKIEAVQAKVDEGIITQEQADLMIQQMTERTELAVNRATIGPAEWRMGGGYGKSGAGAGPDVANRWGSQNDTGRGACYGDPSLDTGPGGMHKWGRGARKSGAGAGNDVANRWGSQNDTGRGVCYGDPSLGTSPGGMHKWGWGAR